MFKSFAVLALAAALYGCGSAFINPGPDHAVAYAIEHISPAVVRLDVMEEEYVGGQPTYPRGTGSGTIIDADGHVLTNFHVAGLATRIDITLANKEQVRATLVGSDHWTDLALVKLDMDDIRRRHLKFSYAKLGDSSKVVLGQPVMAMGTPYGLTRTLTKGIISNTEREIDASTIGPGYETGWFNNWLQMDAAINPGNSGGPLMNLRGEIIGINTLVSTAGSGLGFAIPSNVAKEFIAGVLGHGGMTRSYVGVQLQALQDLQKHYDLPSDRGVLIGSVEDFSPAKVAGVEPSDILLAINGQPVSGRFKEQLASVRKQIADYPVGATLKLTVQRSVKGQEKQMDLTCTTELLQSVITQEKLVAPWGITVRDLTKAYLRQEHMQPVEGVLVTGVRSSSLGETAKILRDYVITGVNNKPIKTIADLDGAVKEWSAGGVPVSVDIKSDRQATTLVMKAPK